MLPVTASRVATTVFFLGPEESWDLCKSSGLMAAPVQGCALESFVGTLGLLMGCAAQMVRGGCRRVEGVSPHRCAGIRDTVVTVGTLSHSPNCLYTFRKCVPKGLLRCFHTSGCRVFSNFLPPSPPPPAPFLIILSPPPFLPLPIPLFILLLFNPFSAASPLPLPCSLPPTTQSHTLRAGKAPPSDSPPPTPTAGISAGFPLPFFKSEVHCK